MLTGHALQQHIPSESLTNENMEFVGRLGELQTIRTALTAPGIDQKRFVVTGISGQGKTTLCREVSENLAGE